MFLDNFLFTYLSYFRNFFIYILIWSVYPYSIHIRNLCKPQRVSDVGKFYVYLYSFLFICLFHFFNFSSSSLSILTLDQFIHSLRFLLNQTDNERRKFHVSVSITFSYIHSLSSSLLTRTFDYFVPSLLFLLWVSEVGKFCVVSR